MPDMNKIRDLYMQRRVAEDKYYELRDAKSDGCCHDLPLYKIVAYDNSILAAADELRRIGAEIDQEFKR